MLLYTSVKVISEYLDEPIAVETTLKKEHDPRKKFPEIIGELCIQFGSEIYMCYSNLTILKGRKLGRAQNLGY